MPLQIIGNARLRSVAGTTVSDTPLPSRVVNLCVATQVGQTPRKLFGTPHPDRMMHGSSSLPIGTIYGILEDYHLLAQADRVTKGTSYGMVLMRATNQC